jgi:phosphopantothenoylcysteine decarboxylase/phosphopantothenate--cysteine ligase
MKTPFEGKKIILGVTGSIACYKAADLASKMTQAGAEVDVILTEAALKFVTPLTFSSVTGRKAFTEADLWGGNAHVVHISLGHQADLLVIAPASANTLAKLAHGIADNLLSITALAAACPLLVAPAMDGNMYASPATQANLAVLRQRGATIVGPASGHLASGQTGVGRMVETPELLGTIRRLLGKYGPLAGQKMLITAGGTEEPIDPVRSITNRSSGKQGFAIAQAALDLGAEVTLVAGLSHLTAPVGAKRVDVRTAQQMQAAVLDELPKTDALVMAAAVADFRPTEPASQKIKKESGPPTIHLAANPDILAIVGKQRQENGYPDVVVGFAAESQSLLENAAAKLKAKNLDLIVANDITASDAGFSVDTNRVTLLDSSGNAEVLPLMSKEEVAAAILERLAPRLQAKQIVHICPREAWEAAQANGEYRAASLDTEGFIHCSRPDQALAVANRYYQGSQDLLLLWIKPKRLHSELRFDPVGEDSYPHIYGPLNLDAVNVVRPLEVDTDGAFRKLPDGNV